MKNENVFDFEITEYFKSYCEVLLKENNNWYGHADSLILSLPIDIRNFFVYLVDDFIYEYGEKLKNKDKEVF